MDTLTLADLHAVELAPRRLMSVTIFQVGNTTYATCINQGSTVNSGTGMVIANNSLNVGNTFALDL